MKFLLCFILAFSMLRGSGFAATNIVEIVTLIETKASSNDWVVTKDFQSITLTRKKVLLLAQGNLTVDPENWQKYSQESDFRITISWDTLLSQAEYESLFTLRDNFIRQRTQHVEPNSKDLFEAAFIASRTVSLPQYRTESFSVYIYSTDLGFLDVRPESVVNFRNWITELLDKNCSKYQVGKQTNAPSVVTH